MDRFYRLRQNDFSSDTHHPNVDAISFAIM